nr:phospho-N-acetylmuramoyl-pentapeptide-transferase [Bacteroidales bacterium]
MLYYLADYLQRCCDVPGAGVFQYISFRTAAAVIVSLLISLVFGTKWIRYLNKRQVGETIRDLGLEGQLAKQGTPTMGGLIILASILIPTILFAKLDNIYITLMLFTTVWLGSVGFLDDYIKVFKKNKNGLRGKYKILAQVILGIAVGATMFFSDGVVIREKVTQTSPSTEEITTSTGVSEKFSAVSVKSTKTTIPFVKNNEFDYAVLLRWLGTGYEKYAFLIFIPLVIFIITAVSNGANLTDGMDGLATGTSAIIGA